MATIQENIQSWREEVRADFEQRAEEASERTRKFVREVPYAAVGAAVHNVERVRKAAKSAFEMPSRVVESARQSPERLRDAFEARAERGRRIIDRVSARDGLDKATDQAKNVRSQARGLGTSVRRVFEAAAEALEDATEATFDPQDNRPYEERTLDELRTLAAEREIAGRSSMNKKQLVTALRRSR